MSCSLQNLKSLLCAHSIPARPDQKVSGAVIQRVRKRMVILYHLLCGLMMLKERREGRGIHVYYLMKQQDIYSSRQTSSPYSQDAGENALVEYQYFTASLSLDPAQYFRAGVEL